MTIRLYWFYLIWMGKKKKEVRLNRPRNFKGDVYLYVSKTNWKKDLQRIPDHQRRFFSQFVGKVGARFTLGKVDTWYKQGEGWVWMNDALEDYRFALLMGGAELDFHEFSAYTKGKRVCYSWDITNLVKFDEPLELKQYLTYSHTVDGIGFKGERKKFTILKPITRAPQSWCYVEA